MTEEQQILSPEDQITQLEAKIEDITNNWKRTAADFENYKKRKEAEGPEMMQFAKELTVSKLMQLEKDMEDLGVRKIKTIDEQFDPGLHEAVEEKIGPPGKILSEIQPGFTLNNKVIIPAKVVVGKQS
jgi:molecular chaperone GrpE